MIASDLKDLWSPAGLILSFQVMSFQWRLERGSEIGDKGDIPWPFPCDFLGVVLLPMGWSEAKLPAGYSVMTHYFSSDKQLELQATIKCITEPKSGNAFAGENRGSYGPLDFYPLSCLSGDS
jgi:hypothetical protein